VKNRQHQLSVRKIGKNVPRNDRGSQELPAAPSSPPKKKAGPVTGGKTQVSPPQRERVREKKEKEKTRSNRDQTPVESTLPQRPYRKREEMSGRGTRLANHKRQKDCPQSVVFSIVHVFFFGVRWEWVFFPKWGNSPRQKTKGEAQRCHPDH